MERQSCRDTAAAAWRCALVVAVGLALPSRAKTYSDWSTPVNLGPPVNSAFQDDGPAISKDGLSLYFGSNRPGSILVGPPGSPESLDIWVAQRESRDDPWGPPINLGVIVNTPFLENIPFLSRDGHWLFFNSTRPGGEGDRDLWVAWRADTHDDFAWEPPVNLGPNVNSAFFDGGASYLETGGGRPRRDRKPTHHAGQRDGEEAGVPLLFFNSNRPGGLGGQDIYVSEQAADGSFGPAMLVAELSSACDDQRPSVRFDGREVFYWSNRPVGSPGECGVGFNGFDLWTSTRDSVFDPWSAPVNLGMTVNSTSGDAVPHIASDLETLFFVSNRPGGQGGLDVYMTTRTKVAPGHQ
jgi:hypothetical protein